MTAKKPGPQPTAPGFITLIIIDPITGIGGLNPSDRVHNLTRNYT